MTKRALIGFIFMVGIGGLLHCFACPAVAVQFPDKNLEAALRAMVFEKKNDPTKELVDDDLKKISILEARGKNISDLTGLEKCTNLALLDLSDNGIRKLDALAELKMLQSLTLADNKICDIAALSKLSGLQYLNLSGNHVRSLKPLAGLTKISALYLADNKVMDIAPLSGLTHLSSLDLARNYVKDLSPLAGLEGLSLLNVNDNGVKTLAPLAKHARLNLLLAEENKIVDLSALVAAAKADAEGQRQFGPFLRLYLATNPLSEAAEQEQVRALQEAGVRVFVTRSSAGAAPDANTAAASATSQK